LNTPRLSRRRTDILLSMYYQRLSSYFLQPERILVSALPGRSQSITHAICVTGPLRPGKSGAALQRGSGTESNELGRRCLFNGKDGPRVSCAATCLEQLYALTWICWPRSKLVKERLLQIIEKPSFGMAPRNSGRLDIVSSSLRVHQCSSLLLITFNPR
jgi:hypothetical protein